MKRFLAYIVVLALCLAAFTGCAAQQSGGEQQPTDAPEATEAPAPAGEDDALERATDYLRMLYKDGATKTPADYQVVAGVVVEDIAYPITWTVTITGGAQDAVVVGEKVDGMITIDINESASEESPYTLTATIAGADSATSELSFERIVPQGFNLGTASYEEIVTAGYELEEDAALQDTARLFGTVTSIDTPYSEEYGNITVTIVVGGLVDQPIQCYRLEGEGVETLAVGEQITVEGVIKNYSGTIEFDAGCTLVGRGEILDQSKLIAAAYELEVDAALVAPTALTGEIISIDTPYSEEYGNVTVTIVCDGLTEQPIQCYRLEGEGADALAVGDVIAVYGTIKNYSGTIEFDAGCTLLAPEAVMAARTIGKAYQLEAGAELKGLRTLTGEIVSIDTPYSDEYGNVTVTIVVGGLTEQPIQCYRLEGEGADALAVGDVISVTGLIKNYEGTIEFDAGCTFTK